MTTSLWLMDNGFFAVRDSAYDTQPDTTNWTRLARYDETLHPVPHQKLSDNVKNATWANGQLTIGGQVAIDSAWIAARQTELTQAVNNATEDTSARATLLQLAENALTQIAADRAAIASGKVALANAATFAAAKPIMNGMLDIEDNVCNRQERIIKALRALLRNGLG
jgi:enamine deaminase RidA (YjgF/YER057c/UK114 family)